MTLMSGNDWPSDGKKSAYDEPTGTSKFENQQGKPVKALIGIVLLVVFAVILARMNPVPHETASTPAWTTNQTTGSGTR